MVSRTASSAGGLGSRLVELVTAHRENQILKEKIKHLPLLEAQLQQEQLENQRLKQLLDLKSLLPFGSIAALVSGRDTQNWTSAVWIDHGSADGIVPDCPVLAVKGSPIADAQVSGGVIGRVIECGPGSSKVLLISDPLSSIAAADTRSGEEGLLQGHGSSLITLEYIDQSADIQPGDPIVTSGLGGVFPPGLSIGKVTKVSVSQIGFKRAEVRPTVSLSSIREVLVLKRFLEEPQKIESLELRRGGK
jgi:rod shape-determining protein MreC